MDFMKKFSGGNKSGGKSNKQEDKSKDKKKKSSGINMGPSKKFMLNKKLMNQ
jgi:hypothetical protein